MKPMSRNRRFGEPRQPRIRHSEPYTPLSLEDWKLRWCPDLPSTAIEQLKETLMAKNRLDHLKTKLTIWRLFKLPKFRKPYLDFVFDLGFMHFRTVLMREAIERHAYDYIALQWKFFKWNGQFRLYRPGVTL